MTEGGTAFSPNQVRQDAGRFGGRNRPLRLPPYSSCMRRVGEATLQVRWKGGSRVGSGEQRYQESYGRQDLADIGRLDCEFSPEQLPSCQSTGGERLEWFWLGCYHRVWQDNKSMWEQKGLEGDWNDGNEIQTDFIKRKGKLRRCY